MAVLDPLQRAQVDQDVGQSIPIGNRLAVANFGPFDAEFDCLAVDAFGSGTLRVNGLVLLSLAIQGIAKARADR